MALPVIDANAVKPDFKAAFNEGGSAATEVRLTISPSGITVRCEHGFLNGPRQNAEAFCAMLKRVQFAPAKDDVGKAAYAVVYVWSRWSNRRWMGSDFPSWDPVN